MSEEKEEKKVTETKTEKKPKTADEDDEKEKKLKLPFEDDNYFKLSQKKYANKSVFKGKTYINIRELYEKDGKMLPSKKGITLTKEEWETFKKNVDEMSKWFD